MKTDQWKDQLFVISEIAVKPERLSDFLAGLAEVLKGSAGEAGISRVDWMQSVDDPTHFTFVDIFRDDAALQTHMKTDHLARFGKVVGECQSAPPRSARFRPGGGFDKG